MRSEIVDRNTAETGVTRIELNKTRRIALLLILCCTGVSVLWGAFIARHSAGAMADFKAIFYGSRCLMVHTDPYSSADFLKAYLADGSKLPTDPTMLDLFQRSVLVCVNLPSSLVILIPFAMLPVVTAYVIWATLMAAGLVLAAYCMWDLGQEKAPKLSLAFVCLVVSNAVILFADGNAACIVVSLCIIAVWCFFRDRFVTAGILCLALSLCLKPHDGGLVWLYFLLAGGVHRKRALQTLAVVALIAVPSVLYVSQTVPNWLPELRSNIELASAHGGLNDPGPTSIGFRNPDPVIHLQSFVSVLADDPHVYAPISYLVSAALLLTWGILVVRTRFSQHRAWLAIASVATLSMLVTYHRQHDAKLLMLTVPACALLWEQRGVFKRVAVIGNLLAMFFTADIPATSLSMLTAHVPVGASLIEHLQASLILRPAPIFLLGLSAFYLWVFMKRSTEDLESRAFDGSKVVWPRKLEPANNPYEA